MKRKQHKPSWLLQLATKIVVEHVLKTHRYDSALAAYVWDKNTDQVPNFKFHMIEISRMQIADWLLLDAGLTTYKSKRYKTLDVLTRLGQELGFYD